MKKIIHISDLHIGYEDFSERFSKIISNLKTQLGEQARDYVLVITGDLIDNAHNQDDFFVIQKKLEELKQSGFEEILVVPGNHDYGTGSRGDKKFVKVFHDIFYQDQKTFPRKNIIENVAFLGLDSMAEELNWYDEIWAEGELGNEQLQRLEANLHEDEVRSCAKRVVYLHHHPFDFRPLHQLKDSRKLKKVLCDAIAEGISIDALLYGHNHEGKSHNGQWDIPRCYDAGSATLKPRPSYIDWVPGFQTKASVRVIDLEQHDATLDKELTLL